MLFVPTFFAACSTAAHPPRTIRSASETFLLPDCERLKSCWIYPSAYSAFDSSVAGGGRENSRADTPGRERLLRQPRPLSRLCSDPALARTYVPVDGQGAPA